MCARLVHPSPLRAPDTPASPLPTPLTLHLCTVGASVPALSRQQRRGLGGGPPLCPKHSCLVRLRGWPNGSWRPATSMPACRWSTRPAEPKRPGRPSASCRGAPPGHGVEAPDGRAEGTRSPWGRGKGFGSRFCRSKGTWVSSLILLRLGSGCRGWRAGGPSSNSGVLVDPAGGRWAGWLGTEEEPS